MHTLFQRIYGWLQVSWCFLRVAAQTKPEQENIARYKVLIMDDHAMSPAHHLRSGAGQLRYGKERQKAILAWKLRSTLTGS